MLSLDDSRWSDLAHAYGPASDIPVFLRKMTHAWRPKHDYRDEPWFTLWSSLCHQGDVYTASYAALPQIVQIALETPGPIDFDFFMLPACIEVARFSGKGPAVPPFLLEAYQ